MTEDETEQCKAWIQADNGRSDKEQWADAIEALNKLSPLDQCKLMFKLGKFERPAFESPLFVEFANKFISVIDTL